MQYCVDGFRTFPHGGNPALSGHSLGAAMIAVVHRSGEVAVFVVLPLGVVWSRACLGAPSSKITFMVGDCLLKFPAASGSDSRAESFCLAAYT